MRPRQPSKPIADHLLNYVPTQKIKLDPSELLAALRAAGRGSAQDLSGTRYEHFRVLIEDEKAWDTFIKLAEAFARAEVPPDIMQAMRMGRMTALQKDDGRVRGIVAGAVIRRLVAKTLTRQFGTEFLKATALY